MPGSSYAMLEGTRRSRLPSAHTTVVRPVDSTLQTALRLARTQYTGGIGSFLQVLDAQRQLLAAQQDLTDNTTQISTTLVSLYKALGGGWEATYPEAQL